MIKFCTVGMQVFEDARRRRGRGGSGVQWIITIINKTIGGDHGEEMCGRHKIDVSGETLFYIFFLLAVFPHNKKGSAFHTTFSCVVLKLRSSKMFPFLPPFQTNNRLCVVSMRRETPKNLNLVLFLHNDSVLKTLYGRYIRLTRVCSLVQQRTTHISSFKYLRGFPS